MGWLGSMVRECVVFRSAHEFLRTHRKGDTVLMVQKGHNHNGSFISLSEFGRDKRRGLIVVPKGRKGEGWKNFDDALMEIHASSISGKRTRAFLSVQIGNWRMNREDGGVAPSSKAGGDRSYSEVLKVVPRAVSDVFTSETVQRHEGNGSGLLGLNEEIILRMLIGLEEKNNGPHNSSSWGPGLGRGAGQTKTWRVLNRAPTEISGQGSKQTSGEPIHSLPAPPPAQKVLPASVDPVGVLVELFRWDGLEDGEIALELDAVETSCEVDPSLSLEVGLGSGQFEPCVEVVAQEAMPVQVVSPGFGSSSMEDPVVSGEGFFSGNEGGSELSLLPKDSVGEEGAATPLCTLPPSNYGSCSSNWIFNKVEELQDIFGISFGGYEEQFMELVVAIEAS
ncbi:uncharacterized protein LOC121249465 [Juglans microcarpa x Juglans regia]|uniref:uncharacterized protein LOC121249465 n=1 Tax=Juglans microcarpa x Juglans regia TaxID=2249226 RepID=UPI001B7E95BF|nr:uncharacterized protein LOC121249465 [Juglans microcarpa x Juglans regia]